MANGVCHIAKPTETDRDRQQHGKVVSADDGSQSHLVRLVFVFHSCTADRRKVINATTVPKVDTRL